MERIQDSQAEIQERFELLVEKLSGAVALTAEGTARLLVRLSVLATVAWILFTIAVTFYASFRYLYLPTSSHLAPVHLNYDTENGHPTAFVQLVPDDTYLLRSGQAYDVSVVLDVPETSVNKDLGVVMVNLELYSVCTLL
jgi:seipin